MEIIIIIAVMLVVGALSGGIRVAVTSAGSGTGWNRGCGK